MWVRENECYTLFSRIGDNTQSWDSSALLTSKPKWTTATESNYQWRVDHKWCFPIGANILLEFTQGPVARLKDSKGSSWEGGDIDLLFNIRMYKGGELPCHSLRIYKDTLSAYPDVFDLHVSRPCNLLHFISADNPTALVVDIHEIGRHSRITTMILSE